MESNSPREKGNVKLRQETVDKLLLEINDTRLIDLDSEYLRFELPDGKFHHIPKRAEIPVEEGRRILNIRDYILEVKRFADGEESQLTFL